MSQRHSGVTVAPPAPAGAGSEAADVIAEACPIVEVLDQVSGKWSISILVAALRGPVRFTELERAIDGISRRMLTLTLRRLERDGLLVRTVYPTVPPKVEYTATGVAQELFGPLTALTEWAERHRTTIARARRAYDLASAPEDPAAPAASGAPAGRARL